MADSHEDEIYSTMFSSLKHPVRRKILRMLAMKPMTFMEMVEQLDVSTPHLTYHLESLGELISKMDNGQYKLSAFGIATVSAMKGVEEVHELEPKRRVVTFRWKAVVGILLVAVLSFVWHGWSSIYINKPALELQTVAFNGKPAVVVLWNGRR